MIGEKWLALAQRDEAYELRDLIALSTRPEFATYFGLPFGTISPDNSAIVGRCGYLFVNDGSNKWREQLHGTEFISDEKKTSTAAFLVETRDRLREQGIGFQFVTIPEKDVVCAELSPNASKSLSASRSIHKIAEAIGGAVVYPLDDLVSLNHHVSTFHTRNSHVNFYGGLQLADSLLAAMGRHPISDLDIPTAPIWWPDDLSIKWVENLTTRRRILSRFYQEEELVQSTGHVGRHLVFNNSKARSQDKIVVFGDSYSWNPDAGLARLLAVEFARVDFVWKKQIDWKLVSNTKPSVVVLQSAERFLISGLGQ